MPASFVYVLIVIATLLSTLALKGIKGQCPPPDPTWGAWQQRCAVGQYFIDGGCITSPSGCVGSGCILFNDYFGLVQQDLKTCPAGYSSPLGVANCAQCPPGTVSPGATYQTILRPSTMLSPQASWIDCQLSCAVCPAGYFQPNSGVIGSTSDKCLPCQPGQYAPIPGSGTCLPCPRDTYSTSTGAVKCTPCAPGEFAPIGSTSCNAKCQAGFEPDTDRNCRQCASGQYSDGTKCFPCSAGSYSNITGAASCAPCIAGEYQNYTGQSSCQPCEPASYSESFGNSKCVNCPVGSWSDTYGGNSVQSCFPCSPGSFADVSRSLQCQPCPRGTYNSMKGAFSEDLCIKCPKGTFADKPGSEKCQDCPIGTFSDETGAQTSDACQACPDGHFPSLDHTKCMTCPAGRFHNSSMLGRAAYSAEDCLPCKAGTYAEGAGETRCESCPLGFFSNRTGLQKCDICPDGTIAPQLGSTFCTACPAMMYADLRRTSCEYKNWIESPQGIATVSVSSSVGLIVLVAFLLVVLSLVICLLRARRAVAGKRGTGLLDDYREQDEEDIELFSLPQFSIDQNLFEIKFEDIKLSQEIGAGGSGAVVFRAVWKSQPVAVKLFRTSSFSEQNDFSEFEHELKLACSLRHPNILLTFGAVLAPPRVGIVTEFCPNGTLSKYIQVYQGKLPWHRKLQILLDISRAVHFLHAQGIVHRDLKLENALVDANHTVKLSDFGISKRKQDMANRQTRGVGTSYYMSPEVTKGEPYDEKCDVFSFSIIMMEVLIEHVNPYAGVHGVTAGIEMRVAMNPFFRPQFPLNFIFEKYQEEVISMMQSCWNHNPGARPSFSNIIALLEKELAAITETTARI